MRGIKRKQKRKKKKKKTIHKVLVNRCMWEKLKKNIYIEKKMQYETKE